MGHVAERDLKGLLAGRLGPEARRRVVRHLLSNCEKCPARLRELIPPGRLWSTSAPAREAAYDAALDRAQEAVRPLVAVWEEERERRQRGLARVRRKGWGNLTSADREIFRGRTAQVELLLDLSYEMRHRNKKLMLDLAVSAERAVDKLRPTAALPAALLFDLRARVAAEVANAERVAEWYMRSADSLQKARALLERGTGDLRVEARIDEVAGTLLNAQRDLGEAEVLLDQARRAYLRLGERHSAGRVLVTKGICRRLAERPAEAVEILRQALAYLDDCPDPQLIASAQQSLLDALVDAGEYSKAGRFLLKSGLRRKFADEPLNLLRLRWLEGKILAARGRVQDAERVFTEVVDGFRAEGLEYVATVACLDIAKVVLRQNKHAQLYRLAAELNERVLATDLPHPAKMAIQTFEILCEYRAARTGYAERVQEFLQRLEQEPSLEWSAEMIAFG